MIVNEQIMFSLKLVHIISLIIGIAFLFLSFYLAFILRDGQFYTSFTLGSWLVLDFIDYRLNRNSILSFFYNHKYRYVFSLFFFVSFIFCFTIDFAWGVKTLKLWEWNNYALVQYIRMYLIMNVSFLLSMYELYRILKTVLKNIISEEHLLFFRFPYHRKSLIYIFLLFFGVLFLISPLYIEVFSASLFSPYILLLPYLSMILIPDAITYLIGGKSVLEDFIRLNPLRLTALLLTVLIGFIITEGLNHYGAEWTYLNMPFSTFRLYDVPVAVLIGWVPLITGAICLINMVKYIAER